MHTFKNKIDIHSIQRFPSIFMARPETICLSVSTLSFNGFQTLMARATFSCRIRGTKTWRFSGCTHGVVSHFKAENVHGPYPRGQCLQVTDSEDFLLEDFHCFNDKRSFTEDTISLWESSNSVIREYWSLN